MSVCVVWNMRDGHERVRKRMRKRKSENEDDKQGAQEAAVILVRLGLTEDHVQDGYENSIAQQQQEKEHL